MNERQLLVTGSLNMLTAVALGAFGAHGLKAFVSTDMLAVWETGVIYHLVHGLGILIIALLMPRLDARAMSRLGKAGAVMFAGIVLFSGSLYLLTLTGIRLIGVVTPFGGAAFLLAWGWVAWAAWRSTPS
jgi:uncharacterized membrane protein YgdD (TMEM256/DUF423 family)